MTLTELYSALSLPHYGFLSEHDGGLGTEVVYDLTAISCLVINKQGSKFNLFPLLQFQLGSNVLVNSSLSIGNYLKQEDKQTPFEIAYGCDFWEMANQDTKLNTIFNDAMACTSSFYMDKNCGDVFQGIESLVDVGGGTGVSAKLIAENFPNIKCTVLDLPHVVGNLPNDDTVKFVSSDMFDYILPANAVLLKAITKLFSETKKGTFTCTSNSV